MKRIVVIVLATIGAGVVCMVLVGIVVGLVASGKMKSVPAHTILEVDFEPAWQEYAKIDPVTDLFLEPPPTVRDIVAALQRAATDERVVALVARVGTAPGGLAQIQEVRDAVLAFRAQGKRALVYAETFGEFGTGNGAYYLATAFDTIYLQPSGDVGLTGLIFESPFVQEALEKLAVTPRLDRRQEYKNFMELFTEHHYTEPHREAVQRVMTSQFEQIVGGIATARGLSPETVRTLIDRGPFLGQEAVDARLVDGLAYRDEVYQRVKQEAGEDASLLYLSTYLARAGRPDSAGATIALIYGVGGIQRGQDGFDPVLNGPTMGADTVSAAFRQAIADATVKAILFRVDSPGGSYVASDTIWRETVRAREAGKPVIVSMGNVAGSGGYFVAMAADKIVAQPGTITGSIGVVGGKMLTTDFWQQFGLTWDEVHTSTNATMWSGLHDYTPAQWARVQTWLDRVYDDFTHKVAQGRGLTPGQVLEVAKGRIWTGEDAKALGLVDELGGFSVALRLVREAVGLPADAALNLQPFPALQTPWEALLGRFLGSDRESSDTQVAALVRHLRSWIRPVLVGLRRLGFGPHPGVLTMPELRTEP